MNKFVLLDGHNYPIPPKEIDCNNHFCDAFRNFETEISANYVVRLCQELGGWVPFTKEQIEAVYQQAGHKGFSFNGLVSSRPFPADLLALLLSDSDTPVPADGGWIVLDGEGKYRVTDMFVLRCFESSPAAGLRSRLKET